MIPYLVLATVIAILGVIIAILYRMLRIAKRLNRIAQGDVENLQRAASPASTQEVTELRESNGRLARLLDEEKTARAGDLDRIAHEAEKEISQRVSAARQELQLEFAERKRTDRQLSNARSRGALLAKVMEHVGPLVPGFPYPLKEVRHIGEIFDFLVYDGLEAGGEISVVFLEVKTTTTGRTRRVTNPREKALREAIRKGRVRYEVWQPPTDDQLTEKLQQMVDTMTPKELDAPLDSQ